MKNKILYLAATLTKPLFRWFLIVWICIILVASISGIYINKTPLINPEENIPTDENIGPVEDSKNHEIIVTRPMVFQNDVFNINNYPLIRINKKIEGGFIEFNIEPYGWIVDKSAYLKSDNFMFAFRFFFKDINTGGYYKVFRNENGGVGNDKNRNLLGAVSGSSFQDGNVWIIPISDKVVFARDKGQFGYKEENVLNYFNSNIGKTVHIGGFTSSVKEEPNGWKLNKINSITIKYIGEEGSIELVES